MQILVLTMHISTHGNKDKTLSWLKQCARVVVLLMVGIAMAVLWLYCSVFLPHELASGVGSLGIAERSAGIVTIIAMIVAPALPIQSLFPKHPVMAAAAVGWMPLALAMSGVLLVEPTTESGSGTRGIASAVLEGCVAWMAIVLGAWIAGRLRQKMRD